MNIRVQKRSRLFAIAVLAAAVLAAALTALTTRGAVTAAARTDISYFYFENASAVCEGDGKLYIANGNGVYVYSESESPRISDTPLFRVAGTSVTQMIFNGDRLFVIENDESDPNAFNHRFGLLGIYSIADGTAAVIEYKGNPADNYKGIAVSNGLLFAARGSDIYKFTTISPECAGLAVHAPRDITGIVAGGGELFFNQISTSGYFEIYRFPSGIVNGELPTLARREENTQNPFKSMMFSGGLLTVLTEDYVFNYQTNTPGSVLLWDGDRLSRPENLRTVAAAAGGNYYAVNYDRAVLRFSETAGERGSAFKNTPKVLIASQSSEWGFYDTPLDVAAKAGRIFTADSNNHRVVVNAGGNYHKIGGREFTKPTSVATDTDGFLYFAYTDGTAAKIAKYHLADGGETPVSDFRFAPQGAQNTAVTLLRADSFGNLYALTEQNALYRLAADDVDAGRGEAFEPVSGVESGVYGMAAGLNYPGFYAVLDDAANMGQTEIFKLTENGKEPVGISGIDNFTDLAADADGGLYILIKEAEETYKIVRYDYDPATKTYAKNAYEENLPREAGTVVSRIAVSAIDETLTLGDGANAVRYRDILVTDAGRHTVKHIKLAQFGIPYEQKTPDDPKNLAPAPDADERILREITEDCVLYARAADVYPVRLALAGSVLPENTVLKKGHRIIVEKQDTDASDYTRVIADNADYSGGGVLVGYVRNRYVSAPFDYAEPDEDGKTLTVLGETAWIYPYPAAYLPKELCTQRGNGRTLFTKLAFVHMAESVTETADGEQTVTYEYGYIDNFGNKWYKVQYGENAADTGYVLASEVGPPGALPFQALDNKNAKIIADADFPGQTHAPVFTLVDGQYIINDTYAAALPVGVKVEVVKTPFDSSREYTLIRFEFGGGVMEGYVRTANLAFEGVDLLKVFAVIVIIATLAVSGMIASRYLKNRKKTGLPEITSQT